MMNPRYLDAGNAKVPPEDVDQAWEAVISAQTDTEKWYIVRFEGYSVPKHIKLARSLCSRRSAAGLKVKDIAITYSFFEQGVVFKKTR